MKTTKFKRLLSVVCVIALCFTMVIPAYATGEVENGDSKASQTILVENFGIKTYGDESFKVVVIPDEVSQLSDFTYESSNPRIAEISENGTITIKAAGETYITVRQAGNDSFAAAEVSQKLVVAKKNVSIASLNLDEKTAVLEGVLPQDADKVSIDFDKITLEKFIDSDDPLVLDGCVKFRGVVVENSITALDYNKCIDTTEEPNVAVYVVDDFDTGLTGGYSGMTYSFLAGDTDAEDYLGMSVIGYAKETPSGQYEIIKIDADIVRNQTVTFPISNFDCYNIPNCEITYYKPGAADVSTAKCESNLNIVCNGIGGFQAGDFVYWLDFLASGQITLIDNDDAKGYDVAFVDLASVGVVKKAYDDSISFYNNVAWGNGATTKEICIDPTDETVFVEVKKNGEVIDYTELEEWDVVSIFAVDENSDVIKMEVVDAVIDGTVSSVKQSPVSATGTAYKIGDTWYDVARGAYAIYDIEIGSEGKFYIDKYGKLVAFFGKPLTYAYINGVAVIEPDFGGTGYTAKLQMVTDDGVLVCNVANNVRINSQGGMSTVLDLSSWYDDGYGNIADPGYHELLNIQGTVVGYKMNSAGYIAEITTADYDYDKFGTRWMCGDLEYDAENLRFLGGGYVDANTKVFVVGPDAANCYITTLDELEDGNMYNVLCAYADRYADDTNIIVVSYASISCISATSSIAVVKEVGNAMNDNGEAVYEITYLQDSEEHTAMTTADAACCIMPTVGDIIKLKLDRNGNIANIMPVWDFVEGIRPFPNSAPAVLNGVTTVREAFAGGVVTDYRDSTSMACINGTEVKLSKAQNIYVVDATGRTVQISTGTTNNFKYYEKLYDYSSSMVTITDMDGYVIAENITLPMAQSYADHVYVRIYEDIPVDVVIVKGMPIKVIEGPTDFGVSYAMDDMETASVSLASLDEIEPVDDYVVTTNSVLTGGGSVGGSTIIDSGISSGGGGSVGGGGGSATTESIRIVAANLQLKGEKAANYNLVDEKYNNCSILISNIVFVEAYAEGGNASVYGTGDYIKGSVVTVTAVGDENSVFDGWYLGSQCVSTSLSCSIIADSNKVIVAKFSKKPTYVDETTSVITVESVKGKAGATVNVAVEIKNNPGVAGMQLKLFYDGNLTLTEVSQGRALGSLDFTVPGDLNANPVVLPWDGLDADFSNGTILNLTFQVAEGAPEGFYPIEIECSKSGIYDDNLEDVAFEIINGGVEVVNYVPGDINGDGVVGTKDVTVLRRYIAGGYDVTVVAEALDVNGDSVVGTKDVTVLRRYIAGGYGIELK